VHALKEPGNEVLNAFLQKFIQTSTCICQAYNPFMKSVNWIRYIYSNIFCKEKEKAGHLIQPEICTTFSLET